MALFHNCLFPFKVISFLSFFAILIPEIIMKISLKLLSKIFHNKLKSESIKFLVFCEY